MEFHLTKHLQKFHAKKYSEKMKIRLNKYIVTKSKMQLDKKNKIKDDCLAFAKPLLPAGRFISRKFKNNKMNKYKEAIPELTKEWIEKGNTILDEKYRELWAKCVPIRLGDLYQGMELGNCLEIVEQLNNGKTVEEVKPLIENQGHSGMSFSLVCSMVKSFCDRGEEFVNYARL